jgi:hypothetical protein
MNFEIRDPKEKPESVLAPGPLFVVSMWRSGSSLLYALLNKHPQVALMYEGDLLLLRPVFLKPKAFCDWAERWEFWNGALQRHGLAVTDVVAGISHFPNAFSAAHRLFAQRHGATIWGDKSPNYYDRLNQMADDFPQARFIIVWRDPNGTANSILRAASLGSPYFSRMGAALCGLLGYGLFKKECDRLLTRGKPVCQVSYEDLILDTSSVMRRVCEFLQIPYDDSLSNLEGADRSAIFDGQHHANVKSDKIVRGPSPTLVTASLRAKIGQYLSWWHQIYGVGWPPYPQPADHAAQPPNRLPRLIDLALYHVLRTRDRVSPIVFSFIPISLLRRYRDLKRHRRETSDVREPGPVEAGDSSGAAAISAGQHTATRVPDVCS